METIAIKKVDDYSMDSLDIQVIDEDESDLITNSSFFPDISIKEVRVRMRLDGTVTHSRLKSALIDAMASVNQELSLFEIKATDAGNKTLNSMMAEQINGESVKVLNYKKAVFSFATAALLEQYRSYDTTNEGMNKSEEYSTTADEHLRNARFAIRDILAIPHMTACLI